MSKNTHILPTTPDTTLGNVWRCVICTAVTNPFSDDECKGSFLHAHISKAQQDCDGPTYQEYTVFLNDEERAEHLKADGVNDFHDLHFKERVLGSQVSFSPFLNVNVEVDNHGFVMREQTDEGYRSAEVRWCEDESCTETYAQRDVFAEMMGY